MPPWNAPVRIGLAAVLGLLSATLVFAATLPFSSGARATGGLALFETAAASARQAQARTGAGLTEANRARARTQALTAIGRDPTTVVAVRSLGLLTAIDGDEAGAARLFRYAETLSRRDYPTQLWLIEENVRRNDIPAAIEHYDIAMRVSRAARTQLVPVLASAASDPAIRQALVPLAARRPSWWAELVDGLNATGNADAIAEVIGPMRLDPADALEGWRLSAAMRTLADSGAARRALALYAPTNADGARQTVRDGDFEHVGPSPPFDWSFTDTPEASGVREQRDGAGGDYALTVLIEGGAAPVAEQLMVLAPGRYGMRANVGDLPAGEAAWPTIEVACAGPANRSIARLQPSRVSAEAFVLMGEFAVPADRCEGQWLKISRQGGIGQDTVRPWIDDIEIVPAGSTRR